MLLLCLRSAFRSREMTMHLVLSAFTSRPNSLPPTNNVSLYSFIVYMLPPNTLK